MPNGSLEFFDTQSLCRNGCSGTQNSGRVGGSSNSEETLLIKKHQTFKKAKTDQETGLEGLDTETGSNMSNKDNPNERIIKSEELKH